MTYRVQAVEPNGCLRVLVDNEVTMHYCLVAAGGDTTLHVSNVEGTSKAVTEVWRRAR